MDSIIARQKIGRRRSVSRSASDRRPSAPLLLNDFSGVPSRNPGEGIARRRIPVLPASGFKARRRGVSIPGGLARPAKALLGLMGLIGRFAGGLRARIRAKTSTASPLGLAAGFAATLAVLLALGLGAAALLSGPAFPMPQGALLPEAGPAPDALLEYAAPELADAGGNDDPDVSSLPPVPVTLSMDTYTVRAKDSLGSIAKRFGLNIDTIISANGITSARSIRSGRELRIPNINGLVYKVRSGDSLGSVARRHKVDTTSIVDANDLGSSRLVVGQSLFIPGARLPQAVISQALGQFVIWPVRGPISSYFGYRPDPFTGIRRFHGGIDIVVNQGTPVKAAMGGRVSDVGYNANYGNYVILSHAEGYQTLYGHLSSILAREGAAIEQGATIGLSGNTGYSTGAHLHFGLFRRSAALNPLKQLK